MNYIARIFLIVLSSLFFTGCEVGITPLEQKYNEAGMKPLQQFQKKVM